MDHIVRQLHIGTTTTLQTIAVIIIQLVQTSSNGKFPNADGNYAYCLQTIMVEDVQVPQVICPGADTIQTSVGLCEVYYEAPILDIEDNCGIQSFGWDVPSGIYSPGDYYLNFSVIDDATNYNGCTMLLVVEDIEQPWITCAQDTILYTTTTCDSEYFGPS